MTIDMHGPSVLALMTSNQDLSAAEPAARPARNNGRVSKSVNEAMKGVHPWYRKAIKLIADGRYDEGRELLAKYNALPQTKKLIEKSRSASDQAAAESTEE